MNPSNRKITVAGGKPGGSIASDMAKMKQRREERKNRNLNENKNLSNQPSEFGKPCDSEYEKLMLKKKIAFNQEPENVIIYFNIIIIISILLLKT